MEKLARSSIIVLIVCMLVSCAKPKSIPAETNQMIEPEYKIGDFLVTTGEKGEVTYGFDLDCAKQGSEENYSCKSAIGKKVNITTGIFDDTLSGKLDEYWSRYNYELFIEGHPVNLQAFGSVDVNNPMVGVIRYWNVTILINKPGALTLKESGVVKGEPFESTATYSFIAP